MDHRGRVHGLLAHLHQIVIDDVAQFQVGQRHRKANRSTKPGRVLDLFKGAVFQDQKADDPEGHLFPVQECVGRLEHSEGITDTMRRRDTAVLEPEARQQCVGFDDILGGLHQAASLHRIESGKTIAHECFMTGARYRGTSDGRRVAAADVVSGLALKA